MDGSYFAHYRRRRHVVPQRRLVTCPCALLLFVIAGARLTNYIYFGAYADSCGIFIRGVYVCVCVREGVCVYARKLALR